MNLDVLFLLTLPELLELRTQLKMEAVAYGLSLPIALRASLILVERLIREKS